MSSGFRVQRFIPDAVVFRNIEKIEEVNCFRALCKHSVNEDRVFAERKKMALDPVALCTDINERPQPRFVVRRDVRILAGIPAAVIVIVDEADASIGCCAFYF